MIYMYKRDDNTPLITNDLMGEIDEDGDTLELVMSTEDVIDVRDYLRSYYHYSDLEVLEYMNISDINT